MALPEETNVSSLQIDSLGFYITLLVDHDMIFILRTQKVRVFVFVLVVVWLIY